MLTFEQEMYDQLTEGEKLIFDAVKDHSRLGFSLQSAFSALIQSIMYNNTFDERLQQAFDLLSITDKEDKLIIVKELANKFKCLRSEYPEFLKKSTSNNQD